MLLAQILSAAVHAQPVLTSASLTALVGGTARTALLTAPLLRLWPWDSLSRAELWAAFCQIYGLPATADVEALLNRPSPQQHAQRLEFVGCQVVSSH